MSHKLSRREALAHGAVSSGLFMRPAYGQYTKEQTNKGPGREAFWEPGPDRNLEHDLTPGPTPVRLANYQGWNQDSGISLGDWVKGIRESGLTAISVPPDPWGSISDSEMREFQAALKEHDVEVFEVCGYCNILHTDEPSRQKNLRHIAMCIEVADRIGCLAVGTISGSRNPKYNNFIDNYAVHPDNWTRETWELLIEGLRQILDDTSGMKAVIGLEAQVTTNLDGPLAHRRIIDDVGNERIKVTLDPINMVCLKNYFHTTELINECFDLLGEDIVGCHGKDTVAQLHQQTIHIQELCTGRGIFDHEMYLVRLSRMRWPRSIWPDHIPPDQMPEAYAHLRKVAKKVGVKIYGES